MDKDEQLPKILVFIFAAIIYFVFRHYIQGAGQYGISKPIVEIFVIIFIYFSTSSIIWVSRYYMPHVAVNNFSGSILGRPIVINQQYRLKDKLVNFSFAVFNTGEFLEPFHGKGKIATLVVPFTQLKSVGRNWIGTTFVKKFPLKLLPPNVYNYLIHHKSEFNLENIYYGKYSEDFISSNPDVEMLEQQLEASYQHTNFLRDILERRNDDLIEMTELGKKLSGSEKPWYSAFIPSKSQSEE